MLNYFFVYPIVWLLILVLYIMNFSAFNIELNSLLVIFIIITSIISLVLGIIFRKRFTFKKDVNVKISYKPIIFILIGVIIEFIYMKQIPLVSIVILKKQEYSLLQFMPLIHVIICSSAMYFSLIYFYSAICNKENRKKGLLCFFIILIVFLLYYTRSFIVIILFMAMNMLISYLIAEHKIKIQHLIISFVAIVLLLYGYGGLGNLRHGYSWNDNSYIEEIGLYKKFPKILPKQFMWSYSYLTSPLANLNYNVINTDVSIRPITLVREIFPETISKRLPIENGQSCNLIKTYFNVSTGYCSSYVNGSFFGMSIVFVFLMFLGIIGSRYNNLKNLDCNYIIFCSLTVTLLLFMFFDNMLSYVGVSIPFWISLMMLFIKSNKANMIKFKSWGLDKIQKLKK